MRWFTAERVAQRQSDGAWAFVCRPYLAVGDDARITCVQATRPEDAVLIHDLGHVLLTPPGVLFAGEGGWPSEAGALRSWLWEQRARGVVALCGLETLGAQAAQIQAMANALGLSVLDESLNCTRALTRRCVLGPAKKRPMLGALEAGDPFDAVLWDLDAPGLWGLELQAACHQSWCGALGRVHQIWMGAEPLI